LRDFCGSKQKGRQLSKGTVLKRTEAIRLILRTYLSEKGFIRQRGHREEPSA
jgi:hypothetical protein